MPRTVRFVLSCLAVGTAWSALSVAATAEERIISMYHVHTKERITIAYWKDGHYIPSALKKLNWFLRDWRKNKAVRMDPRTIDLIWKLHEDLGSKKPVWIICGHRSAATNAMLRRIGRHVARRSRHITGQAIDFRFPDVPNWKVRNLALAYGIGGVGYYGRSGFIHADTGRVRHWPRLSARKLAAIKRRWRSYIGYRNRRPGSFMIAAAKRRGLSIRGGAIRVANVKNARHVAAKTAGGGKAGTIRTAMNTASGPISLVPRSVRRGSASVVVPLPKARPYQVLVMAASRMEIVPASAPATESNFRSRGGDPLGRMIARVAVPQLLEDEAPASFDSGAKTRRYPRVNRTGKGDLALAIVEDRRPDLPTIRLASLAKAAAAPDVSFGHDIGALLRHNGAPQPMQEIVRSGKGDPLPVIGRALRTQRVNRAGKGDLLVARLRAAYARRRVPVPETLADRGLADLAGRPLTLR